ncbi:APC family permease [Telmatobacter sp. DSM 110680]|uniref:APC family permease n=1 Tax=Telmatobacter sp. DSM 110680 TaxID=3036704 RepID=A0AAU7DR78_9BACT
MATAKLKRALGFRDLLLFYVASGLSLRWIATAAASGPSAIAVWLTALLGFFVPLAACVLDMSARYPAEGGLYIWTREAFGPFSAFISAWTYWMSNLPYFPSVLFFAASSLLYLGGPMQKLAESQTYFLVFTVVMLGLITILNVVGLGTGKWLNNLGAIGGMIPALVLIGLGLFSFMRFGSATHFTLSAMVPRPGMKNLIFLSTIFFAFGGCEAGSFMGDEIREPRRVIPRSLFIAGLILGLGYIAGTLSMLVALPAEKISGLGGFMTAVDFLAGRLSFGFLVVPIAVLVAVSNVGAASAYLSSTARLPFVAGVHRYLPAAFGRIHSRFGTPYVAIISYGAAGILFGLLGQAGASIHGAYDMLVSMAVITYFIPYLFLFASAIRLQNQPLPEGSLRLPGGRRTIIPLAYVGLLSTACTIVLSLFPAEDDAHPMMTFLKVVVMTLVLLGLGIAVYRSSLRRQEMDFERNTE